MIDTQVREWLSSEELGRSAKEAEEFEKRTDPYGFCVGGRGSSPKVSLPPFQVVVCDSPWDFSDSLSMSDVKRSAQANYDTLSIQDIKALPINQIADPNGALLALWVPSSLLTDGLEVMQAWGFTQKQTYIWVKQKKEPLKALSDTLKAVYKTIVKEKLPTKHMKTVTQYECKIFDLNTTLAFGMGRLWRQTHELALIGINNNGIYEQLANKSQRSVSFAINQGHSIKPEHLQDSLDLMFPTANKLEVFARRQRPGWTCIGNQAPATQGQDIRATLNQMIATAQVTKDVINGW